jgi:serine/threonine protein kinase
VERLLHRGGWSHADVLLVRHAGKQFVVKDFSRRAWLLRSTFGRWSIGRERRAYRALDGIDAVPRLLGLVDPLALAIEYRPGSLLSRSLAGVLPADFLGELRGAVAAMHARGVVHLDLRHRSNILATPEGHPVLIDFASSLRFDPGARWSRWLLDCCIRLDRRALTKWELRLAQDVRPAGASAAVTSGTTSASSRGASRPM